MEQKILTPFQSKILEQIRSDQSITTHFYFTGGTALSHYYFQHRLSEVIDYCLELAYSLSPSLLKT